MQLMFIVGGFLYGADVIFIIFRFTAVFQFFVVVVALSIFSCFSFFHIFFLGFCLFFVLLFIDMYTMSERFHHMHTLGMN